MDILDYVEKAVKQGKSCYVNFKTNTIRIGRKTIMKDGETEYDISFAKSEDPVKELHKLYEMYKYSIPSAKEESKRKGYFTALAMDDISDERLVTAVERSLAKARLEVWFVCAKLNNSLIWNSDQNTFFWQSDKYPELIVLKDWLM